MNILVEKRGGKIVLSLKEERIDAHNSGELKDLFLKVLEEEAGRDLVIDLDQVQFIESSGLGALLSGLKNAGLRSSRFILGGFSLEFDRCSNSLGYSASSIFIPNSRKPSATERFPPKGRQFGEGDASKK